MCMCVHVHTQDMMDREKKDKLPHMQVGFIDNICLPVYEAMARVSTKLSPLLQGCQQNRSNWLLEAETAEKNQSERHRQAEKHAEEQRAENSNKDNDEKTTSWRCVLF